MTFWFCTSCLILQYTCLNLKEYEITINLKFEFGNVNILRTKTVCEKLKLPRDWEPIKRFCLWIPGSLKICSKSPNQKLINQYLNILAWKLIHCIVWIIISNTCHSIGCTKNILQHLFRVRLLHTWWQQSKVRKKVHLEQILVSDWRKYHAT